MNYNGIHSVLAYTTILGRISKYAHLPNVPLPSILTAASAQPCLTMYIRYHDEKLSVHVYHSRPSVAYRANEQATKISKHYLFPLHGYVVR